MGNMSDPDASLPPGDAVDEPDSSSAASPSPSGHPFVPDASEEIPPEKPVTPEQDPWDSSRPTSAESDRMAGDIPLTTNPQLRRPFSQWDLSGIESPMFIPEGINDFGERSILLTGKWSVKPHLSLTTLYDGNIFVKSEDTTSDFITRIEPGLTMRLGDADSEFFIVGDYTAGVNWYMQHPSDSTVDHTAKIDAQWSLPRTTFGLHLGLMTDTGADIDVSNRVKRKLYFAGITSHYAFGEKTSWDVNADYSRSDYQGLISSSQIEGQVYFNYEYSPKLLLGVGGTLGYLTVEEGQDQWFEQASVRATYRLSGHVTLIADGGVEFRQYRGGGNTATPVFGLQAAWLIREGTELDFSARRQVYASAILNDQNYTATSLDFTVRQRCTDRVDLSLSCGFVNASYSATTSNVFANREDNFYYIRPAVQWRALSWLSVGIFYEYSQDLSSGGGARSFTRDRGGIQIAILF